MPQAKYQASGDALKTRGALFDFVQKEWLLIASGVSLVLTSLYTNHIPDYSFREFQVLFILFILFVAVHGLQRSGLILKLSRKIEKGKTVALKLVITTFILSMLVTNDVALIVIVPLTLALHIQRKDLLVIFEALAANAGSALTPFGNPQNLFIYWFYELRPTEFMAAIAPFSIVFLFILIVPAWFMKTNHALQASPNTRVVQHSACVYGFLLIMVLLIVLHALPVQTGIAVIIYALLFDRKTLHIDYALLFSFFFFFGVAENMKILLASGIQHSGHIFLFSALASQIMSNVPVALLTAKLTENWQALLWGTNAGGFGSIFASFANLIAYKMYVTHSSTNNPASFTAKFLAIGYIAFFLSIGLYFTLHRWT